MVPPPKQLRSEEIFNNIVLISLTRCYKVTVQMQISILKLEKTF
jgi:hypothetical protein